VNDTVVVGAGLAGLAAALRLAAAGRRVTVLALGVGGLPLSPGVVDVLGYAPDRVERPGEALDRLAAERPSHPYAVLGRARVERALAWLREAVDGYALVGGVERNMLLPTAVGVARPTAMAPETMAGGDLRAGGRYVVVGLRALRDLHARIAADNLARARTPDGGGVEARAVLVEATPRPEAAEVAAPVFARAMDGAALRRQLAEEIRPRLEPGEVVGIPAVLGMRDPHGAWSELQERLGTAVFEIATPPPSVPGLRLNEILSAAIRRHGGRIVIGPQIVGAERAGGGIRALVAETSGRRRAYEARSFVLAPGGFESGALHLDSRGTLRERALGLPLAGVPDDGLPPFSAGYWDDHPILRAGVAVDERMRPVDADGRVVHPNLRAAGAILAGATPWREKSGEGIAVASGVAAADAILEEGG